MRRTQELPSRNADAEEEATEATGGTPRRGTTRRPVAARRATNLARKNPTQTYLPTDGLEKVPSRQLQRQKL